VIITVSYVRIFFSALLSTSTWDAEDTQLSESLHITMEVAVQEDTWMNASSQWPVFQWEWTRGHGISRAGSSLIPS